MFGMCYWNYTLNTYQTTGSSPEPLLESYGGGPIIIKKTALELMTPCHCICQPPHTVEVIKVKVNRWKATHLPVKVFSAEASSVHEVKKE